MHRYSLHVELLYSVSLSVFFVLDFVLFNELGPFLKDLLCFILFKGFGGEKLRLYVTFHPDKLFCPAGNPANSVKLGFKWKH